MTSQKHAKVRFGEFTKEPIWGDRAITASVDDPSNAQAQTALRGIVRHESYVCFLCCAHFLRVCQCATHSVTF